MEADMTVEASKNGRKSGIPGRLSLLFEMDNVEKFRKITSMVLATKRPEKDELPMMNLSKVRAPAAFLVYVESKRSRSGINTSFFSTSTERTFKMPPDTVENCKNGFKRTKDCVDTT